MRVLPPALFCHKDRPVDSEVSLLLLERLLSSNDKLCHWHFANQRWIVYLFCVAEINLFYYGIEYNYNSKAYREHQENHCFLEKTIMIILILSKRGKHQSTSSKILLLNDSVAGYWSYSYLLEVLQINEHISRSVKNMTSELLWDKLNNEIMPQ